MRDKTSRLIIGIIGLIFLMIGILFCYKNFQNQIQRRLKFGGGICPQYTGDKVQVEKINKDQVYSKFFKDGRLVAEGTFRDNVPDGLIKIYFMNGQLESLETYEYDFIFFTNSPHFNGCNKKHGAYELYYENGNLREKGFYENDMKHGVFVEYYENGSLKSETNWENGKRKF